MHLRCTSLRRAVMLSHLMTCEYLFPTGESNQMIISVVLLQLYNLIYGIYACPSVRDLALNMNYLKWKKQLLLSSSYHGRRGNYLFHIGFDFQLSNRKYSRFFFKHHFLDTLNSDLNTSNSTWGRRGRSYATRPIWS